jgi:hypothetical protein
MASRSSAATRHQQGRWSVPHLGWLNARRRSCWRWDGVGQAHAGWRAPPWLTVRVLDESTPQKDRVRWFEPRLGLQTGSKRMIVICLIGPPPFYPSAELNADRRHWSGSGPASWSGFPIWHQPRKAAALCGCLVPLRSTPRAGRVSRHPHGPFGTVGAHGFVVAECACLAQIATSAAPWRMGLRVSMRR